MKRFKHYVRVCQHVLDLHNLKIRVEKENLESIGANAACTYDYEAGNLQIYINRDGVEKTFSCLDEDLAYLAWHEVFEGAFFGPITTLTENVLSKNDSATLENHAHSMINVFWKLLKDKVMA